MPSLSPTMSAGTIVKWHKKEGDKIAPGDLLCEVQTDKAVMAYEFDDEGVLARILVQEGSSEIAVGELIAIVCGEEDDWKAVKVPEGAAKTVSTPSSSASSFTSTSSSEPEPKASEFGTLKIAPAARNLLHQYGLEVAAATATGNRGTLLKEDVLRLISSKSLSPKSGSEQQKSTSSSPTKKAASTSTASSSSASRYIDLELTSMRRTIAKRLTESKTTTPHAYMSIKCFMDELLALRANLKAQHAVTVSVNDLLVKAVGIALAQVPAMNCQWDKAADRAVLIPEVDISIAVATPTGLITPIIRGANRLTLAEINLASRTLIGKAKEGKLQPNDFIGGTFSISNLGMYDVDHFTGVINPPQAAILAVGSTRKVFVGEPEAAQLRSQMTVSLSYDARAVDEETVAGFMERLQANLEKPEVLLHSDGTSNRRRLAAML